MEASLKSMNMRSEELSARVRSAFGHVHFPSHRGIRAAMAMDDWITNEDALAAITAEKDIHGEWWQIPFSELRQCALGLSYLDAAGLEFYLPAYLNMALADLKYEDFRLTLQLLDPGLAKDDLCFRGGLSAVAGTRKEVCVEFLQLLMERVYSQDPLSIRADIERILEHPFWKV